VKVGVGALVCCCVVVVVAAPFVGDRLVGPNASFIFWQLRVPRVVVAVFVGGMLSIAGATFQALFNNPLATPSTAGTIAGATLGALAATVFPQPVQLAGQSAIVVGSFVGALGASLIVAAYAWGRHAAMAEVLLAGIAVTLAAGAAATAVQSVADSAALFATAKWSLGQLSQVGYQGAWLLAPIVIVSTVVLVSLTRALQVLAIDEDMAHAQGVAVVRVRIIAILAAAFGVAGCVAWCGPITFVGLVVPHLVRRTVGSAQRVVLPLSLPCGAAFLVLCDTLARIIMPDRELPVGVITAGIGATVLMGLVSRRSVP
jgi:iron complex transport system permease protein